MLDFEVKRCTRHCTKTGSEFLAGESLFSTLVAEGADVVMVKPALACLDIIHRVKQAHPGVPLAAYNVSGEYAMLCAAVQNGWLMRRAVVSEALLGFKRAGADAILTYFAEEVAGWLQAD